MSRILMAICLFKKLPKWTWLKKPVSSSGRMGKKLESRQVNNSMLALKNIFNQLDNQSKLSLIKEHGEFIATASIGNHLSNLYLIEGLYVEKMFNPFKHQIVHISLCDFQALEKFTTSINLKALMKARI